MSIVVCQIHVVQVGCGLKRVERRLTTELAVQTRDNDGVGTHADQVAMRQDAVRIAFRVVFVQVETNRLICQERRWQIQRQLHHLVADYGIGFPGLVTLDHSCKRVSSRVSSVTNAGPSILV